MRFRVTSAFFAVIASFTLDACVPAQRHLEPSPGASSGTAAVSAYDLRRQRIDFEIGEKYIDGKAGQRRPEEGVRLLQSAARGPDSTWRSLANLRLGEIARDGIDGYLVSDRVSALSYFQKAAADHSDLATSRISDLSVFPDVIVALNRAEFTARPRGTAPGGLMKGLELYRDGDDAAAFPIMEFHAKSGSGYAQWVLADMYKYGHGVAADPTRYKGWCYMAAQNGEPTAQLQLGIEFYRGDEVPASDSEAEIWLTRAADQGIAEAHRILGIIALSPKDPGRKRNLLSGLRHFEAAAAAGSEKALLDLGRLHLGLYGFPRNSEKAKEYYLAAADAGNDEAKTILQREFKIAYKETKTANVKSAAVRVPKSPNPKSSPPAVAAVTTSLSPAPAVAVQNEQRPSLVDLFATLSSSVVQIIALTVEGGRAKDVFQGSGVVIGIDLVLTNCHVLEGTNAHRSNVKSQDCAV